MKRYSLNIDKYQAEWIFSPIRSKREAMIILMRAIKILLLNDSAQAAQAVGKIELAVSKMSRIFFVSSHKVYSLNFPFSVAENDGALSFKTHSHSNVDHKVSSDILSLLESPKVLGTIEVLEFAESVDDVAQYDKELWGLFQELLLNEEGYIRYDYDEKHKNGHYHPLNHLDIFFSSNSTFKLGLHAKTDVEMFIDVLDSNTMCHYLSPVIEKARK